MKRRLTQTTSPPARGQGWVVGHLPWAIQELSYPPRAYCCSPQLPASHLEHSYLFGSPAGSPCRRRSLSFQAFIYLFFFLLLLLFFTVTFIFCNYVAKGSDLMTTRPRVASCNSRASQASPSHQALVVTSFQGWNWFFSISLLICNLLKALGVCLRKHDNVGSLWKNGRGAQPTVP